MTLGTVPMCKTLLRESIMQNTNTAAAATKTATIHNSTLSVSIGSNQLDFETVSFKQIAESDSFAREILSKEAASFLGTMDKVQGKLIAIIFTCTAIDLGTGKDARKHAINLLPEAMQKAAASYWAPFTRSVAADKTDYFFLHGAKKLLQNFPAGTGKKAAEAEAEEVTAAEAEAEAEEVTAADTAAADTAAIIETLRKELAATQVKLAIVTQERDSLKVKCNALEQAAAKAAAVTAKRSSKTAAAATI